MYRAVQMHRLSKLVADKHVNITNPEHENDDVSLRKQLKEAFLSWLETSTSHGLPNIAKTTNAVIKIVWFTCFVLSLAGCSYFIANSLMDYLQYQPVVKISVIQEYPTNFPAVTICNLNPFDLSTTDTKDYIDYLLADSIYSFVLQSNGSSIIAATNDTNQVLTDLTDTLKRRIVIDDTLTKERRRALGFSLEKMLISCAYNKKSCSHKNFSTFFSYDYGNCYTFNSGYNYKNEKQEIYQTAKVGSGYGMVLELLLGDSDAKIKYTSKTGIYLILHNQTKAPITIEDGDGIYIATGTDTYVSVKREFRSKLEDPYSNCVTELNTKNIKSPYGKKLFGYMIDLGLDVYDQSFCYRMCYQDKLIGVCNCSDARYPNIQNASYCETDDKIQCLSNFDLEFAVSNIEKFCGLACPLLCDSVVYDVTTSIATYPSEYYKSLLLQRDDVISKLSPYSDISRINNYLAKITVNYNELSYVFIEEVESTTIPSLIGNLGGTMGLFIGISLLSIIEIIEITLELVRITWSYKTKSKKKNTKITIAP